ANSFRVKVSISAGFTGGSPDVTTVPSAEDEKIIHGGGTDSSPSYETLYSNDGSYRLKGGADDASPYGFWVASIPIGGGNNTHAFLHEGLDAADPSDGAPWHLIIGLGNPGLSRLNIAAETESGNN